METFVFMIGRTDIILGQSSVGHPASEGDACKREQCSPKPAVGKEICNKVKVEDKIPTILFCLRHQMNKVRQPTALQLWDSVWLTKRDLLSQDIRWRRGVGH